MLEKLLDIIFPPKCEICGKLGRYICDNCYRELEKYKLKNNLREQYFLYIYEERIRSMLINYKFNDRAYIANIFSFCILNDKSAIEFIKKYDVIVAVPLHKRREKERGYNQSKLVIEKVLKKLNDENIKIRSKKNGKDIKVIYPILENKVLIKTKNTKPQSTNKLEDRIQSVKGIYRTENITKIINKKVLVFDDIYTTGSTYKECKKMLLDAGAKQVGIITIARDFMKIL